MAEAGGFEAQELFLGPVAVLISRMPGGVSRRRKAGLSFVWLLTLGRRLCGVFLGPGKCNASVVVVVVASQARLYVPPLTFVAVEAVLAPS